MAIKSYDYDDETDTVGLCVPQDNLDDLDFFPNFSDDFISITDLNIFAPENETIYYAAEERKRKGGGGGGMQEGSLLGYKMPNNYPTAKRSLRNNKIKKNCGGGGLKKIRKCSHCETEVTPLWRVGPMGPNTLCNACGVRYKSGRLLPEYRPAASPSFDSSKHSNYHRKIVQKMRQPRGY